MIATYHNHTTWSDGKTTIADLCAGAADLGVEELGISDHFVLPPAGPVPEWSMDPARLGEYVEEVRAAPGRGVTVRVGLEVDWFPGHADALGSALDALPFDYLIGSVHHVGDFVIDGSAATWEAVDQHRQDRVHRDYWVCMRSLAQSGLFDIAAHIDLTKKFGHRPSVDLGREIGEALDAIADAGMVVELNTAGWHKPCGDAYPSADLVAACHERSIPVTISADAHEPAHLLRDFDRGLRRLADAGYTEIARFAGRRVSFEPIEAAVPG